MKQPNFFIVGAPKSATTALVEYLRRHPEIFLVPGPLEPGFFAADLHHLQLVRERPDYLRLFEDATDAHIAVGEKTVWHMYSKVAAQRIHDFQPDAKIIVMLRNPVDVIAALHGQQLRDANEVITDLKDALEAESERMAGHRIPRITHFREGLFYRDMVRFDVQVQRYLDTFDRSQIHIIIYDDFQRDTRKAFQKVLAFLEVDTSFETDFSNIRGNANIRSHHLHRLLHKPPDWLERGLRAAVPINVLRKVRMALVQANAPTRARRSMPRSLRQRLLESVGPEIDRLGSIIGRDLTMWHRNEV